MTRREQLIAGGIAGAGVLVYVLWRRRPAPEPEPVPEPEPFRGSVSVGAPRRPRYGGPAMTTGRPPAPAPAVPGVTIEAFMDALARYGEGNGDAGWSAQNVDTAAYGRWQMLPGFWRAYAPAALGGGPALASKTLPPAEWRPMIRGDRPEGRANQTRVARYRIEQLWKGYGGDAQKVAGTWQSGNAVKARWSRRTVKYVNRVCVPLGYPELPLPPRRTADDD